MLDIVDHARSRELAAGQAGQQRVRAQPVRPVVLVVALADGIQALDVGHLVSRVAFDQSARVLVLDEVHPQAAHGVVDGREDPHRGRARIFAYELFVDFENAAELDVNLLLVQMRQV